MSLFAPDQKLKAIPEALKNEINTQRLALSSFFNGAARMFPSCSFANEGTGFGKSYNVIREYLVNTPIQPSGRGHRNLLFMTPQKAQIRFGQDIVEMAKEKGVKFLSFLARTDRNDLDYVGWVTKTRNEELYTRWAKVLRKSFPEQAVRLDTLVQHLRNLLNQEERLSTLSPHDLMLQRLQQDVNGARWDLLSALQGLVTAIVEEDRFGEYITLDKRFERTSTVKDQVILEIIDHLLPLERAKRMPTILLATSKRFLFATMVVNYTKGGKPSISTCQFDDILGQKLAPTNSVDLNTRIGSVNGKSFEEQITFLREQWFRVDPDNVFRQRMIDFTVVVDEEHVAYSLFFESTYKKLITDKHQVHHVFATLSRLVNSIKHAEEEDIDDIVLYEPIKKLSDELFDLYNNRCQTSVPLDTILAMCERNLGHIAIDTSEVEQILTITKNIFAMSPRRFYAEEQLKQIRIREHVSGSELLIYKQRAPEDTNPSLYDLLQALMCVLVTCSHISNKHLLGLIKTGDSASQNSLLYDFIVKAGEHRQYINAVFDRSTESDIFIDQHYAYLMPKMVFSLVKVHTLEFEPGTKHKRIYVSLLLDLFLELPEVILLRLLHGTRNSVMCLSATTGFKQSYSGSFTRDMLQQYGTSLDFKVLERSDKDRKVMAALRDARQKARDVQIRTFHDSARNMITDYTKKAEFKNACLDWREMLTPYFYSNNRHHTAAFQRQIEAMLLTAWDGRHSMILSLNNRFQASFKKLLQENRNGRFRACKPLIEDMVIDISPFNDRPRVRVILFDANLAKHPKFEECLKVDENTKIAFISSYNSAGTGLNLVIEDTKQGIEEDFERLVLINTPYYTEVFTEEGLNTVQNHILMLKYHAANTNTKLSDFDTNLLQSKNRRVLSDENLLSRMKVIIQAIGRIERRDTYTTSEIIMPDDVMDSLVVGYSHLLRNGNDLMLDSLSLLNCKVMEFCLEQAKGRSFASDEAREDFQRSAVQSGKMINGFFENDFRKSILQKARAGDLEAAQLNEALRNVKSITAPRQYVQDLLKHPIIKAKPYYQDVIGKFYFWQEFHTGVTLCTMGDDQFGITDMSDGQGLYQPYLWLVPEYLRMEKGQQNAAPGLIRQAANLDTRELEQNPPSPALLPLLKGNVGEFLFSSCLKKLGITPLSIAEQFELLTPEAYELYDVYLVVNSRLVCIDVKNWSASLDKEDMSRDLLSRAAEKRDKLTAICSTRNLEPEFVYVNARHDHNALNDFPEYSNGTLIRYMNLFKKISAYSSVGEGAMPSYSLSEQYVINPQLLDILRGRA
jgi:hypothetical protein